MIGNAKIEQINDLPFGRAYKVITATDTLFLPSVVKREFVVPFLSSTAMNGFQKKNGRLRYMRIQRAFVLETNRFYGQKLCAVQG